MSGDTCSFYISFKNDDNTPKVLTGIAFKMQVKIKATDATPKLTFDLTTGLSIGNDPVSGAVNNTLFFEGVIPLKGSSVSPAKPYVYDIQATDSGVVTTYVFGNMPAQQDVTDANTDV
jgi:hypothetical protein